MSVASFSFPYPVSIEIPWISMIEPPNIFPADPTFLMGGIIKTERRTRRNASPLGKLARKLDHEVGNVITMGHSARLFCQTHIRGL